MPIDNSRVLLVEGKDDKEVVKHFCRAHGIEVDWGIEQVKGTDGGEGVEYLLDQVPVRLKESGIKRLGVLVDADENAQGRWESLRDRLRRKGYKSLPENPEPGGILVDLTDDFGPKLFGVWIMPNNEKSGMLEDFLAFLMPGDDELMSHVDRFLHDIPPGPQRFTDIHLPKARIHSYLAVQRNPGKPLGLAITHRYLDPKNEQAEPFLNWLRKVFLFDI